MERHKENVNTYYKVRETNLKGLHLVLWPPHAKSWLIGKDFDAGRDWGQEGKGTTKDEMAGWHHWLDGRESEWTPGVGDGQGGLACCDSWGRKELDTTEQLNWTELHWRQWLLWLYWYEIGYRENWYREEWGHWNKVMDIQKGRSRNLGAKAISSCIVLTRSGPDN